MRTTLKSSFITEDRGMATRKLTPIHPGEVLLADFLEAMGISQYRLAQDISVPPRRINEIVLGKRAISADTALRLARYFGTSERFWLNLQSRFDLEVERDRLGDRLRKEVKFYVRPADTFAAGGRARVCAEAHAALVSARSR
jgi:addiction module HigA family antidote